MISGYIAFLKELVTVERWTICLAVMLAAGCVIGWVVTGDYRRQLLERDGDHE